MSAIGGKADIGPTITCVRHRPRRIGSAGVEKEADELAITEARLIAFLAVPRRRECQTAELIL